MDARLPVCRARARKAGGALGMSRGDQTRTAPHRQRAVPLDTHVRHGCPNLPLPVSLHRDCPQGHAHLRGPHTGRRIGGVLVHVCTLG